MRLIKTEYNGNQVVKLSLILYIRLYLCNCLYLTILPSKICLERQSVYSLFYSWPKQSLKCLSIFPSLGFPQLWPEAILNGTRALDLYSYLHRPKPFI